MWASEQSTNHQTAEQPKWSKGKKVMIKELESLSFGRDNMVKWSAISFSVKVNDIYVADICWW